MPEDETGLYLDTPLSESAQLACLLRQWMPDSVDLMFCDQGYNVDVRVSPGLTVAELIEEVDDQP
ncbi:MULTISPECIES: hypothetical protein [unclassified Streptomyces]|uniref:hypothetical protein n=1 Tax=unclassified Streptomyces TaxID=2593676 RepID=UPI00131AE042|nr:MULTISPECIES: hypothetical protein [unclassified Streptomyces]